MHVVAAEHEVLSGGRDHVDSEAKAIKRRADDWATPDARVEIVFVAIRAFVSRNNE